MQLFEVLLPLLCILFLLFNTNKKFRSYLLFALLGVFILHVFCEGIRWQMTPIYLVSLITAVASLRGYSNSTKNSLQKISIWMLFLTMMGLGIFLSSVLPIFKLPKPSGTYQVGSQNIHISTDLNELITEDISDKREFMVKVWYPAKVNQEPKEAYSNAGEQKGFARKYGLPENTFNYLNKIKTHTFINPKLSDGRFPVLIFSHGYQSNATEYYALLEEIVSHGFIVFNINHTYESTGSLFPSGEIKYYSQEYNDKVNNKEMGEMIWKAHQDFKEANNEEEKLSAVRRMANSYFAAEVTHRWAKDIDQLIQQIPSLESTSFLKNHMDLSKIGVFGHSQGGAAAGQAIINNKNIAAAINIDGVQWGTAIDTIYSKPFLYLSSDWPEEHPNFNKYIFKSKPNTDFFQIKLLDSGHATFQDIPFIINLASINQAGSIEKKKALKISAEVVIQFFGKYLKDQNINLMDLNTKYPELIIQKQ